MIFRNIQISGIWHWDRQQLFNKNRRLRNFRERCRNLKKKFFVFLIGYGKFAKQPSSMLKGKILNGIQNISAIIIAVIAIIIPLQGGGITI